MKPNTCLVLDVWEGQMDIVESVLLANDIAGIGIRLNDMNGGHHRDTNFLKQWEEAKHFVRFPYFVYNPWVDGTTNFKWLKEHIPSEALSVAIDIEVKYDNYPPTTYADEVKKFMYLCFMAKLKTIIYTGQGYTHLLSSWPKVDYWWAQYPSPKYYFPDVKTWDELKVALNALDKPFNFNKIPGPLKMWQFSGDYLILPGTKRDIDVNIFYGTKKDLANYFLSWPVEVPKRPSVEFISITSHGVKIPKLLTVNYIENGISKYSDIDQRV